MRMIKLSLFPHFSRIFSATFLWTSLTLFWIANVYARANLLPDYWDKLILVLNHPSTDTHVLLGQTYRESGFYTAARRELLLAQELSRQHNVLGASTQAQKLLDEWEKEPMRVLKEYQFLQRVVKEKQDYRDGYVSLSALSYQLSKVEEGKEYLNEAMSLDPNNALAQKLLPFFP